MKIGVNARALLTPFTGIGQYTKNLFMTLPRLDKENEYILVVPKMPEESEDFDMKNFPANVKFVIIPEKKFFGKGFGKTYFEQIQLKNFWKKEKVDLVFYPYPCNPWSKKWHKQGIKTLTVAHDCIPWKYSQYRKGLLSKMYHHMTKKFLKYSDVVITVSEYSKKEIKKIAGVSEKKIKVIYNDAAEEYKKKHEKEIIPQKYFIYVGGYDSRKNVAKLISEFLEFRKWHPDIFLILAGGKLFDQKLYESYENFENEGIIKTGFLSQKELAGYYRGAIAYVNLSKEEGFNIPLLEAANSGIPLIISDIPVHREIMEGCALFVDLDVSGDAKKKMEMILETSLAEIFAKKASARAKEFDQEKSAKKMRDVLSSLMK